MKALVNERFLAHGFVFRGDQRVPVTISGEYSPFEPRPVNCTVVPDMKGWPAGFNPLSELNPAQIEGRTENGEDLWISRLSPYTLTVTDANPPDGKHQRYWKGDAELLVIGDLAEFDASQGEITCFADIPPTPLADSGLQYTLQWDGTIGFTASGPNHDVVLGKERSGIRWQTKLGQAELIDNYAYATDQVGLDKAVIQIKKCQIVIRRNGDGHKSLRDDLEQLHNVISDDLWLLSFLSRKRLNWYSAEAFFEPKAEMGANFRHVIARRNALFESESDRSNYEYSLPIRAATLRSGLFSQLLSQYKASPLCDTIRRTIIHLLMFYENHYLEAKVGSAYSALECLVHGVSGTRAGQKEFLFSPAIFGPLCSKLKTVIQEELGQEKPDTERVISNLERLNWKPQVAHLSLRNWIQSLAQSYQVDLRPLWPPGADIDMELQNLVDRRDVYIHQGKFDEVDAYVTDAYRLQNIVERLVLKLLGCSDVDLNPLAINSIIPLNNQ